MGAWMGMTGEVAPGAFPPKDFEQLFYFNLSLIRKKYNQIGEMRFLREILLQEAQ
jgi:hypothetical protein